MRVFVYLHPCTRAYIHMRIHAYKHTSVHAQMHTRVHACAHACMHVCTCVFMHARMHACVHARKCVCQRADTIAWTDWPPATSLPRPLSKSKCVAREQGWIECYDAVSIGLDSPVAFYSHSRFLLPLPLRLRNPSTLASNSHFSFHSRSTSRTPDPWRATVISPSSNPPRTPMATYTHVPS